MAENAEKHVNAVKNGSSSATEGTSSDVCSYMLFCCINTPLSTDLLAHAHVTTVVHVYFTNDVYMRRVYIYVRI